MTTLNGIPRYWEAFIQGICSRRKLTKLCMLSQFLIKLSLMETALILLAMIIYFLCLDLASSSYGATNSSFTNLSRSFSCRMRMILYFHALKFSVPSKFSSSLVFYIIFNRMKTSNGTRRNNTYLKKTTFD